MTATATRARSAGANATNQALASLGSLELGTSSAVPVLPATVTPGSAADDAGAVADDVDHHRPHLARGAPRDRAAAGDLLQGRDARLGAPAAGGDRRAHAGHRQRRGEVAVLADRRRPDREVVAQLTRDRARLGVRDPRLLAEPNASAAATSRRAPSFAPSGANTELHECANELTSEPPQASPPALRSVTPSSVAAVWTGYIVDGRTIRLSSAAAAVMILNTEPGGCGADTASPASARTAPSRGRITAMPPSRSPRAADAARLSPGSIVVFTGRPRTARVAPPRGRRTAAAPGRGR